MSASVQYNCAHHTCNIVHSQGRSKSSPFQIDSWNYITRYTQKDYLILRRLIRMIQSRSVPIHSVTRQSTWLITNMKQRLRCRRTFLYPSLSRYRFPGGWVVEFTCRTKLASSSLHEEWTCSYTLQSFCVKQFDFKESCIQQVISTFYMHVHEAWTCSNTHLANWARHLTNDQGNFNFRRKWIIRSVKESLNQ